MFGMSSTSQQRQSKTQSSESYHIIVECIVTSLILSVADTETELKYQHQYCYQLDIGTVRLWLASVNKNCLISSQRVARSSRKFLLRFVAYYIRDLLLWFVTTNKINHSRAHIHTNVPNIHRQMY